MGNRVCMCILVKQTSFIIKWLHKININNKHEYNTPFIYMNEDDDFVLIIWSITFDTLCILDLTSVVMLMFPYTTSLSLISFTSSFLVDVFELPSYLLYAFDNRLRGRAVKQLKQLFQEPVQSLCNISVVNTQ